MWNTDLFDFSDDFITEFRDLWRTNGYIESIDMMDDEDMREFEDESASFD